MSIKKNLEVAIAAIEAAPESEIDLAYFRSPCGTHHCALGLLTTVPYFINLGLYMGTFAGLFKPLVCKQGHDQSGFDGDGPDWLDEMFGTNAYDRLFIERGEGDFDEEMLPGLPDKGLALARLREQLEFYL